MNFLNQAGHGLDLKMLAEFVGVGQGILLCALGRATQVEDKCLGVGAAGEAKLYRIVPMYIPT